MATKIENLKDLFVERGRELYEASMQEQRELPDIQKQISDSHLKEIIDREISSARNQSAGLKEIFRKLSLDPKGEKDECCQSILKETKKLISRSKQNMVRDAAIIDSIQRLNHNNITSLGSLAAYALEIGEKEMASSLHEMLEEEKVIDNRLSELAEKEINKRAAVMV